jgi:hypothetical protein
VSGVALTAGLKVVLPQPALFNIYAGLILSFDTVMGLPRTRRCIFFLFQREDLVRAAVRWLQSPACCILTKKDVHAFVEVLVHEKPESWRAV